MNFSLCKSIGCNTTCAAITLLGRGGSHTPFWTGSIESKGGALVRESTINGGFKHMQYELHSYEVLALSGLVGRTPDTVGFDQ